MRKNKIYTIIMYTIISILIFPLLILVIWSFSNNWAYPNIIPKSIGLRGLRHLICPSSKSLYILLNSIILSLVVTVITIIISIPAAKALGVYDFKGKKIFKILILAPIIVPTVSVAMGIHVAFIKLRLANTYLGVVLVHLIPTIPYSVRILTDVFEIIGEKMELQAKVLGANKIQTFLHVTLPMIAPGIVSAGSLVFIISFSQYFLTFLIGGGKIVTFSMIMFPYIQSGDRMMASVYSLAFIITSFIILFFMEKAIKKYYKSENNFYL